MSRKTFLMGLPILVLFAGIFLYQPSLRAPIQGQPAQAIAPNGQATAVPPDVINGAEHPELIPDLVAYRLFFITVALESSATDGQKARQRAQLMFAGLRDTDLSRAASVLSTFKVQYDYLVNQYNDSVDVANRSGRPPDLQKFLNEQDELVQQTKDALAGVLAAEGMTRFEGMVQHEKRNMTVAKEDR
jgi:hypothetical protein